jgi:thiol-disulfide isomerase/thioredoxin
MRRIVPLAIILLGIVSIAIGTMPQNDDVTKSRNISSVICLSCLGITSTTSDDLTIDDLTRIQYTSFKQNVTIYMFSTKTCTSCPRVIQMCDEIAKFSDNVTSIEVKYDDDVEGFRELAAMYEARAESVGVPWMVVANESGDYISWLYESYRDGYPKQGDMRYVIQIIDAVIELGTT